MLFRTKRKAQLLLSVPEPCSEDWNRMHVVDGQHRHCDSCVKNVVDFTQMSDDELALYFRHAQGNICGRLRTDQVQRPISSIPGKTAPAQWWKAAALLPFTFFAKTSSAQNDSVAVADTNVVITTDTLAPDSLTQIAEVAMDTIVTDSMPPGHTTRAEQGPQQPVIFIDGLVVSGYVLGNMGGLEIAPTPTGWSLTRVFDLLSNKRRTPAIEQSVMALLDTDDPSKPPAAPAPPAIPESPWYEAILPSSIRIRRNG
jgi:hypothetical protein